MENHANVYSLNNLSFFLDNAFERFNFSLSVPMLFNNFPCENHFVKIEHNSIAAFCATYLFTWSLKYSTNSIFIKGACIGAVSTAKQLRNKGYAKELIYKAETLSINNRHDFIFLFSDLQNYYTKLGFTCINADYLSFFDRYNHNSSLLKKLITKNTAVFKHTFFHELTPIINNNIDIIYYKIWEFISINSQKNESLLSFQEFLKLIQIPDMRLLYTKGSINNIKAIAFFGKGIDFNSIMHGAVFKKPEDFLFLLSSFSNQYPKLSFHLLASIPMKSLLPKFNWTTNPTLFIKPLPTCKISPDQLIHLINSGFIYPRSIQSA